MNNVQHSDELAPVIVDLNVQQDGEINESFLKTFGWVVKKLLNYTFGGPKVSGRVRGTEKQVGDFQQLLGRERRYMEAYQKYGLADERTYDSKHALDRAVASFERSTGIKWPFQ